MKLFKFLGSLMEHTEKVVGTSFSAVNELAVTVEAGARTAGFYVKQQERIADEGSDYVVSIALLELKNEYNIVADAEADRVAQRGDRPQVKPSDALAGLL